MDFKARRSVHASGLLASTLSRVSLGLQKHPWFRKGLPDSLDVDKYNSHFVELSKAPDVVQSRQAIKHVMEVRLNSPHPLSYRTVSLHPYGMSVPDVLHLVPASIASRSQPALKMASADI